MNLLLSRPPLAAKPGISDHLTKAPDPLCGAMFVRQEGACDHLPLSCTFFFFCTLRPFWAFCQIATLRYLGNKRRNTAVWGCLVLGCHLAVRSGTQGFTGAMAVYLSGWVRSVLRTQPPFDSYISPVTGVLATRCDPAGSSGCRSGGGCRASAFARCL